MKGGKLIFSALSITLIVYLISLIYEVKLDNEHIQQSQLTGNEVSPRRYLHLREIDPNFKLHRSSNINENFYADSNGFIEPSGIHKNADFDIVFLGGSTTECISVDEKLRFPYLTGQLLEQKTRLKVNTYNGARAGNNSLNSYTKLLNVVLPMDPDYVVMMHAINDMAGLILTSSYWNKSNKNRFMVASFDSIAFFDQRISPHHQFNRFFPHTRRKIKKIRNKYFDKPKVLNEWEHSLNTGSELDTTRIFKEFKSSLNAFVLTSLAWDVEPILMTQHNRITADLQELYSDAWVSTIMLNYGYDIHGFVAIYSRMNVIVREVAKENNISCIDLDKHIPRDEKYITDQVHLNNEGSELVAQIITDTLFHKLSKK